MLSLDEMAGHPGMIEAVVQARQCEVPWDDIEIAAATTIIDRPGWNTRQLVFTKMRTLDKPRQIHIEMNMSCDEEMLRRAIDNQWHRNIVTYIVRRRQVCLPVKCYALGAYGITVNGKPAATHVVRIPPRHHPLTIQTNDHCRRTQMAS